MKNKVFFALVIVTIFLIFVSCVEENRHIEESTIYRKAEEVEESTEEATTIKIVDNLKKYDDEKPEQNSNKIVLGNLCPNGEIPFEGVINEDYIYSLDGKSGHFIYANPLYSSKVEELEGIEYDSINNTLTLHNFISDGLEINLMGNGFRLIIEGDNELGTLGVWGYRYGSSITISGEGTLTINRGKSNKEGISLNGDLSKTALIIESGTVEAYGKIAAVMIHATELGSEGIEKGIYYYEPTTLLGGIRSEYIYDLFDKYGSDIIGYKDYTIVDDNGFPASHIKFQRK